MSDAIVPGSGGNRFDAVERLRRRLEGLKAAEAGSPEADQSAAKLTRLPRSPRRMTEEPGERPRKTWRTEGDAIHEAPPTRPVLRSELQRDTGWWTADPGQVPDPDSGEQDGSVIDLGAVRRKRARDDAPAAGIRRRARPRRIGPSTDSGDSDSPQPDGPPQQ
ncbi:hypothetical protein AB0M22_31720 [Nocardia sp. NPDC051756]|uniref:hypothetical protein n=1 Tax=Nocardia sp. NPDC051756 TaxID=3154751 RepID=UPI003440EF01